MSLPPCPKCHSEYIYEDGTQYACLGYAHEWNEAGITAIGDDVSEIKDANGAVLQDSDTVVLIKGPKVEGSSMVIKRDTKAKGIRL